MNTNLTKQEKIIIALLRGHHLEPAEIEIAKQQVQALNLNLKTRIPR